MSDIHLGHPRTPTAHLIEQIDHAFFQDDANRELDILYLAGDIFHQQLTLSNDDVMRIVAWGHRLVRFCSEHQILLRILEGTPSHDRTQSKLFQAIMSVAGVYVDYAYISTISIEYIAELDIHVLYIPDQPSISPEAVLVTVDELMESRGLQQVDYAIMHGHFKHQLPEHVKHPSHDADAYLQRVKYLIHIGHVHTSSQLDRIFAQGSVGRLAHGEEEPKGYYRQVVYVDGTFESTFVENVRATKYVTIDLRGKTLEDSLSIIDALPIQYPQDSHIRLRMHRDHPWASHFLEVQRRSPYYYWTKQIMDAKTPEKLVKPAVELAEYAPLILNKETLPDAIRERIKRKSTISPEAWTMVETLLAS